MSAKVIMRFHGHDIEGDAATLARINTELTRRDDLLALAKQLASECCNCAGTGAVSRQIGGDGYGDRCAALADVEVDCADCRDIRVVVDRVEGRS